jgi:hypothetical protein
MIVNLSQPATQNFLKASGYPANEQWRISSSIRSPFQQRTIPSSLFDTQSNTRKLGFTVLVRVFSTAPALVIHIFAFCLAEIHSFSTVAEIMRMTNLVGRNQDFVVDLFDRFFALVGSQEETALSLVCFRFFRDWSTLVSCRQRFTENQLTDLLTRSPDDDIVFALCAVMVPSLDSIPAILWERFHATPKVCLIVVLR